MNSRSSSWCRFRWVYCQVVYICGLIPARIRHALAELPETLDETYERTLREINKAEWEIAHRLFQLVTVARRPLLAKELADLLAFDFEVGPIPKFHEEWRLEDPVDAVLSTCSSLLAIVDVKGSRVIQFSHFSVKEFLTSARLAKTNDITPRRFHVSETPAHTLAAQACLGILLYLDNDVVTSESLGESPLAEYAAEYWADHARSEDVSQNVEDGMKQLFDPSKPHLSVCVWICDPNALPWMRRRVERPAPLDGTSLHYASLWGLRSIVEFLVNEYSQDVHSHYFPDNVTPLHLASRHGRVEVVCFLIEHGADVTAQNQNESSPLHEALRSGKVEVARILIERGADVTAREVGGVTPLHRASRQGQLEIARVLIERGADIAARTDYGQTPLHLAAEQRQLEVGRMLIERGANIAAQTKEGETSLLVALRRGYLEFARMLIERGADGKGQRSGSTSLHHASREGEVEIVRVLIERGADVTAQDETGSTPLHRASREGQVEIACVLIEHGADVTTQDQDGSTPLHLASNQPAWSRVLPQRCAEVVRTLLEYGADGTVEDKNGCTPFDLASRDERLAEVAEVLLEHGADPGTRENTN